MELNFKPFDADQHYYEALDAFTRYQDKSMARRGVQVLRDLTGRRTYVLIGERVSHFIPNPTFDPVIVPGSVEKMFRGEEPASLAQVEPVHPEYMDRDERVKVMDQQGMAAVLLFPTLGVGVEQALRNDPEAAMHAATAFNRWLEDDWGYAYQDRIFATPILSLADPKVALVELNSLLARGAKAIHIRPAPIPSIDGPRSFGHPDHDPVWATLADAGVPVAFHLGDSGYLTYSAAWGGASAFEPFGKRDPLDQVLVDDRAIHDTMASLVVHGVFHRHPRLRVASIENGSDWVARVIKRLKKKANQMPEWFPEDPHEVIRHHVWVSPYYEEDLTNLAETIGVDKIMFGSDWPHGEGLAKPVTFTKELTDFSAEDVRKIMRDNAITYLGSEPAL